MSDSKIKYDSRKRIGSASGLVLAENVFMFKEQPEKLLKSRVRLFQKYITIQPQGLPQGRCKIQIDFDTVYSILRNNRDEHEEKTHSGIPFGIKIQKYADSIEILNFDEPDMIEKWRRLLGNFLNQKNFHQCFKPLKKIGRGNFATVYLVQKNQDHQLYAVKAFSKEDQYAEERGKQSIENQIKIMRALDHPNLMKLDSVFETDNSLYMVLEYLKGGLLYDKIKKRHAFTTDQVVTVMKSILAGLSVMHQKRLMHRDLKPENILFREEDSYECVIADFGLATHADEEDYIFTRCGTPGYVAPEISNLKDNNHYEPICDMFSVGVIFHIITLGVSPFPGRECDEVLKQNRQCRIDFQTEIYTRLRPSWLDLLKRMLEKEPQSRISAKEALKHPFFQEGSIAIVEQLPRQEKYEECDSPLMITKNNHRKRNLRLREDSCLKFKMKENLHLDHSEEEENIDRINSPLRKRISRPRSDRAQRKAKTVYPSNFKE